MIGVVVQPAEQAAVREFFELCKTPWEFYRSGAQYNVLLDSAGLSPTEGAPLVIILSGADTAYDRANRIPVNSRPGGSVMSYAGRRLPIYAAAATFPTSSNRLLTDEPGHEAAIHASRTNGRTIVRIGYNLFAETSHLLSKGQPVAHAGSPTLDLHMALLRDVIARAGIPLVEIPPVPAGHAFVTCLTHDIDHPILRNHRFDHTMFGFLYRSTWGSLVNVCAGRSPAGRLWRNWSAAARLPFIHLGVARDLWRDFDRYLELEAGRRSTFFVVPEKDYAGRNADGPRPAMRACRYDLDEIAPQLKRITSTGGEVGLHGLDAWLDAAAGRRERDRVARAGGTDEIGVRMHWLYFDEGSPARLDEAGFTYDSSFGYNETVGYRAGTAQVFRPLHAKKLLELPLHVMDTAMFYPDYLNLREDEASRLVGGMVDHVAHQGGALTVNWHDRSIAPERLWGDFYLKLLQDLSNRGAWFPTASQAVAWFRQRRSATLKSDAIENGKLRVRARVVPSDSTLPGFRLRVRRPCRRAPEEPLAEEPSPGFVDSNFGEQTELTVAS